MIGFATEKMSVFGDRLILEDKEGFCVGYCSLTDNERGIVSISGSLSETDDSIAILNCYLTHDITSVTEDN